MCGLGPERDIDSILSGCCPWFGALCSEIAIEITFSVWSTVFQESEGDAIDKVGPHSICPQGMFPIETLLKPM